MKFSENWLREWVNPNIDLQTLAQQLTMAGLEVEEVTAVIGDFEGVVVGRIVRCTPHPNANKLYTTKVDVGDGSLLDIVCGAENCRSGLMVACAKIGAQLPDESVIKTTKIRGELSSGMLCSYADLGIKITTSHKSIIELPKDASLGENVKSYLQSSDHIIDVNITPNRGDCFSLMGIAREVAAINSLPLSALKSSIASQSAPVTISDTKAVVIEQPELASRYLNRVIKGINIGIETPDWIKDRLCRSGIRCVDVVVDVTNYVMIELGQPMHAFDFTKIAGDVVVRYGRLGETLTLLGGQVVEIKAKTLVVADSSKVLALAGILGGLESSVSSKTEAILLEAAFFSPIAVVGKGREYGLHTESLHRFERGVDFELCRCAMERATTLLLSICGGQAGPITEVAASRFLPKSASISLTQKKIDRLIGCSIAQERIIDIFNRLSFKVKFIDDCYHVTVPSWRSDVQIEEDLIEEITRIYGYENIPAAHAKVALTLSAQPEELLSLAKVRNLLVGQGYQEIISYSFVNPKIQSLLHQKQLALVLPNPVSNEMSVMRLSLWSGLLEAVCYNQSRQQSRLRLFETGLRFIPDQHAELGVQQELVLSGVVTGMAYKENWSLPRRSIDFFDVKGDLEAVLELAAIKNSVSFEPLEHSALHSGQSAALYLSDKMIGVIGALHPQIKKHLGIRGEVILFECLWQAISQSTTPQYHPISRFPANRRDIAITVDGSVPVGDVIAECKRVGGERLVDVNLFDVYQGGNIKAGKKSLAISLILQDNFCTLQDSDITNIVDRCVKALQNRFGALLRE